LWEIILFRRHYTGNPPNLIHQDSKTEIIRAAIFSTYANSRCFYNKCAGKSKDGNYISSAIAFNLAHLVMKESGIRLSVGVRVAINIGDNFCIWLAQSRNLPQNERRF
jgi:hypothetical protein